MGTQSSLSQPPQALSQNGDHIHGAATHTTEGSNETDMSPNQGRPINQQEHIENGLGVQVAEGGSKDFGFLPIRKTLRFSPGRPFKFGALLNISFALGTTITVMNVYYCQPLLIQFANSFNATESDIARIPTLVQAGYTTGLLFLSPLGDLVRRRPLVLLLVFLSASLSIGLAITHSLVVFEILSFLIGVVSVTPQIFIPLTADLAPLQRRASAVSIVISGLLFGILLARVLAGIIAQFVTWRVVFYVAVGLQYSLLLVLYFILPDWPAKNKGTGITFVGIMSSMVKYAFTEPVLIQACLITIAASACYTNFWVTLTFLLGGPPYHYSTLEIGLFGLVGMAGVAIGPLVGRKIDKLVPWVATLIATCIMVIFQAVLTGAGGITIAAVILTCIGLDVGRQMQMVSLTMSVYSISDSARARLNAVMMISLYLGGVMGTSAGANIFTRFGWRAASAFSMGLFGFQLVILFIRGPHCQRYTWLGWEGGMEPRKKVVQERERRRVEEAQEKAYQTAEQKQMDDV